MQGRHCIVPAALRLAFRRQSMRFPAGNQISCAATHSPAFFYRTEEQQHPVFMFEFLIGLFHATTIIRAILPGPAAG
jgi:hypothetical protein